MITIIDSLLQIYWTPTAMFYGIQLCFSLPFVTAE